MLRFPEIGFGDAKNTFAIFVLSGLCACFSVIQPYDAMSDRKWSRSGRGKPPEVLPEILPVFPLTGVLLLPGTVQPLHVFEQRYRNMVADVLAGGGLFGMIQPIVPRQDNQPTPGAETDHPELYDVGCAGWVGDWKEMEDGAYVLQLNGHSRFRVIEELPLHRGYRRVKADFRAIDDRGARDGWQCDRTALMEALAGYGDGLGLELSIDQLKAVGDNDLINALGVAMPFRPEEKQALLEAATLVERESVLLSLLRLAEKPNDDDPAPAPVN